MKEPIIDSKSGLSNGISVSTSETFKLVYFGSLVIDKRYTSCMLPWIVAEIKRKCEKQTLDVVVGKAKVTGTVNETLVEHCLVSISKCIKLEGKEASTFAYLTKDTKNNTICSCHVFEAENTTKANRFLLTLKHALEECKSQLPVKENEKTDAASRERRLSKEQHPVQYNVTYVGKLAVSHRRAPPTLIDTSVERFRHHNQQITLTSQLSSFRTEPNESETTSEEHHPTQTPAKTMSMDIEDKRAKEDNTEDLHRPRSVSDGTPASLMQANSCQASNAFTRPNKSNRKLSLFAESRSLTMNISVHSVSFSSSVSGRILMERKVQEISFCQQGTLEPEHFGFICHDPKSSHYHCYVFRAESKHEVDNIMKSLRRAFNSAWQAVGSSAACENCPLHKLHCLCQVLKGEKPADQESLIRQHLMDNFGDSVVDDMKKKYQTESKRRDVVEQNEIMMSLLRQLYEEMQKVHRHSPSDQSQQTDPQAKERPPQNRFIAKAKRSLGDIFRPKIRNSKGDGDGAPLDEADSKYGGSRYQLPKVQSQKELILHGLPVTSESKVKEEKNEATASQKILDRPKRTHRRSYSDISQVFKSPTKVVKDPNDSREHVSDDEHFVVEHPQSVNSNTTSSPKKTLSRKQSYRRAIFDSVVTPSKLPKNADGLVPNDAIPEGGPVKKSREELKALWRKAIWEQRLLIRMEKENSKLRAGEGIAKNKRLKLEYQELLPSNSSANEMWSELLTNESVIDEEDLIGAVKSGVPKDRRGEIWRFLLKQDLLRHKREATPLMTSSYKELKERTSAHQHAILIDCNRTFPAHPYFSQHVGVGQFALFNLLKVYSNVDSELGYCQGLSFVAGILLMHLGEEEAFEVLKHLNYNYGLRNQYMPDMAGLRVQFYQYSRLLHDACPSLHDHFENYEVTPTLYAASWFLTLFASLFPVSFACRVLDLLCLGGLETVFKVAITLVSRFQNKILACESFEAIVDFLKIDLPKLAVDEQESIVNDVLGMDIGDKLLRFEVEYQVFQEEEINPSLLKPVLENTEKLAEENKDLKQKLKQKQEKEKILLEKIKELEAENTRLRSLTSLDEFPRPGDNNCDLNGDAVYGGVNGDNYGNVSGNTSPGFVDLTGHNFEVNPGDITGDSGVVNGEVTGHSYATNGEGDGSRYSTGDRNCSSPTDDNTDSFEHILGETDDEIDTLSCDSPLTIDDSLCDHSNSPESEHDCTKL